MPFLLAALMLPVAVSPQSKETGFTNEEFVKRLHALPGRPDLLEELVIDLRRRGIAFRITPGLRSLVATRSGNNAVLRRTLEEAERRFINPAARSLPPAKEAQELLEKTREASIAAAEQMPDFVVRQLITRYYALGSTSNWRVSDRLTIAVSYRASAGEEYRVLAVNGLPPVKQVEGRTYEEIGGTSTSGEYVSMLASLFRPETHTEFTAVDTDLLRGRSTIVYEYEVKREFSRQLLKTSYREPVIVGYKGRIWIDRELNRVLRMEDQAVDIPANYPVTAKSSLADYDWVTIAEQRYLLPSYIDIRMTAVADGKTFQSRNEVRYRGYQKYGTEVKIIDDIEEDEPPDRPTPN